MTLTVLAAALTLQGCAAASTAMLGTSAGSAVSVGVTQTMRGDAYKTFTASLEKVQTAAEQALSRMAIMIETSEPQDYGRTITASLHDRVVDIEFERLTAETTQMRVVVKEENGIFRDGATAAEIISQTSAQLDS